MGPGHPCATTAVGELSAPCPGKEFRSHSSLTVFKSPCMKLPKEINCLQAPGPSVPRDPWDEFTELSINTAHEAQPCCWPGRSSWSHILVFWECHCPPSPPWPGKPRAVCRGPEQCSMLENPNPELRRDPEVPKPWTSWG